MLRSPAKFSENAIFKPIHTDRPFDIEDHQLIECHVLAQCISLTELFFLKFQILLFCFTRLCVIPVISISGYAHSK